MGLGHALRDFVDASHAVSSFVAPLLAVRGGRRDPVRMGGGEGVERGRLGIGADQGRIRRRAAARSGGRCTSAGPGRRRPGSPRRRTGSGRRAARRAPRARRSPRATQWRYQSSRASCSTPSFASRFSTRRLLSGWMSAAMVSASARTWARSPDRPAAAAAPGNVASSQAMIARLWVSRSPSASSIGTRPCGLQRAIGLALLLAVEQVDRHALIVDALEVERDPHPVARRGAVIIVEDELHAARS